MKVSVVIAAFNVQSFICRAIDSVRAQTISDWEILVIDDASRDGTADLVRNLMVADPRIALIRQPENRGPSAARNRGIEAARGEWIAILDSDDSWRPERLEKLLALAASTNADIVADDLIVYDEGVGGEVGCALKPGLDLTQLDAETLFSHENPLRLGLMKPLIRRSVLIETGRRYDEALRSAEDFLLYAELMLEGARAVLTRDAYYVYTMRVGPVSRKQASGSRSTTSAADLIRIADVLAKRHAHRLTPVLVVGLARFRRMSEGRRTSTEITACADPATSAAFCSLSSAIHAAP